MTQPLSDTDTNALKPCPFCGTTIVSDFEKAEILWHPDHSACPLSAAYFDRNKWNTRPEQQNTDINADFRTDLRMSLEALANGEATVDETESDILGLPELTNHPTAQVTDAMVEAGMKAAGYSGTLKTHFDLIERIYLAMLTTSPRQAEGWQPIETAPHAMHVLACRFDDSFGEWVMGVVLSPPSHPFTHWRLPPEPPAALLNPGGKP